MKNFVLRRSMRALSVRSNLTRPGSRAFSLGSDATKKKSVFAQKNNSVFTLKETASVTND